MAKKLSKEYSHNLFSAYLVSNINDNYFDGLYKDIWKSSIPAELTTREVDFLLTYFHLNDKSKVLDLMCGYGRHTIALAQKGVTVIAVDNLAEYIDEVKQAAKEESLPVKTFRENVISFRSDEKFDLVLCMGNSLNFFSGGDVQQLLNKIASYLKPGGHLLINTWSLAEIIIKNFTARSWSEIGSTKFLTASEYLFHPTRVEYRSTILSIDGKIEEKKGIDFVYSVSEMEAMLDKAGLGLKEIYSIPGRKKFTLGEPRAYIVAHKS